MTSRVKNVLITGATGFIGRRAVELLSVRQDLNPLGLSRRGGRSGGLGIDAVDLSSREAVMAWRASKPRLDAVIHLAAELPPSFDSDEAEGSFLTNIAMTQNALLLACADGAAFVYASGTSVYADSEGSPKTEESPVRPDNLYVLSKYVGEMLCDVARRRHELRAACLRIAAPYGPGQMSRTVIRAFLDAAHHSSEIRLHGSGGRVQDFTYVDDVCQALALALEAGATGVYNISGGRPASMRELAQTVLTVVPQSSARVVFSGEPDPQETYRGVFSIEKARRELGYQPRWTLSEGLARCAGALASAGSGASGAMDG